MNFLQGPLKTISSASYVTRGRALNRSGNAARAKKPTCPLRAGQGVFSCYADGQPQRLRQSIIPCTSEVDPGGSRNSRWAVHYFGNRVASPKPFRHHRITAETAMLHETRALLPPRFFDTADAARRGRHCRNKPPTFHFHGLALRFATPFRFVPISQRQLRVFARTSETCGNLMTCRFAPWATSLRSNHRSLRARAQNDFRRVFRTLALHRRADVSPRHTVFTCPSSRCRTSAADPPLDLSLLARTLGFRAPGNASAGQPAFGACQPACRLVPGQQKLSRSMVLAALRRLAASILAFSSFAATVCLNSPVAPSLSTVNVISASW